MRVLLDGLAKARAGLAKSGVPPRTKEQLKRRRIARKRRARLARAGPGWTKGEWVALVERFGGKCLRCGKRPPEVELTADHVVPIARKGRHAIDNVQPLCRSCNSWKGTKSTDFRQ